VEKLKDYWSGQRVMERWGIHPTELGAHIYQGLPAYLLEQGEIIEIKPQEISCFSADRVSELVFDPDEIIVYEEANELKFNADDQKSGLSPEEARELGKLRMEKENWNRSIAAAVDVGIFCACHEGFILKKEITDHIYRFYSELPDTTIEKIWKAIPEVYKKKAGRPKKENHQPQMSVHD